MNWEIGATILVLAAALVSAWPELQGMTTASLWQDELFSIEQYSSKGPLFVITHYHEANNHILFNLINSLTPGEDRFNPFFARFWSFAFVLLTVVLAMTAWGLAGLPFLGSLQVFLLLANMRNIDLLLQARGYGLLALIALSCALLTWDYFLQKSLFPLLVLPLLVWLGSWTVPTFAFFGGSLLLVLFIYSRDWRWLPAGAAALIGIIAAYWPVHRSLFGIARTYTAYWGKEFGNWSAISDTLTLYFLFGMGSWFTFLVFTILLIAVARSSLSSPANKAALCLGLAVLTTFILCLKMETAAKRTVAFLVVPLGFIALNLLRGCLRNDLRPRLAIAMTSGITAATIALALYLHATYRFIPIEAWRETARMIEKQFPKGTQVVATFRSRWIRIYLSDDYPIVKQLDKALFTARKQIVVDSSFALPQENAGQASQSRFPVKTLPLGYRIETVPQIRGGSQRIYFSPP